MRGDQLILCVSCRHGERGRLRPSRACLRREPLERRAKRNDVTRAVAVEQIEIVRGVDFRTSDPRRNRQPTCGATLTALALQTFLAALADGSEQLPVLAGAWAGIVTQRNKAGRVELGDVEPPV